MKNNLITTLAIALLVSTSAASISFAGNSSHAEAVAKKDVIDIAVGDGNFKTLASLLTKAELVETLKGEGPFTVFAPT
ncbi:MAG: fasciclin domain-containing protein, partial [Flavobacteriales bacterium]